MADKKDVNNPFSVLSYLGGDCFCDRERETAEIIAGLQNGRNITLNSIRKMGKTGLIRHIFAQFDAKNAACFYVDLDQTRCLHDFVKVFSETVLSSQALKQTRVLRDIMSFFRSVRPTVSADPFNGMPQLSVAIQPEQEEASLKEVFAWLEQSPKPCYVAFDEFQNIADYPEPKMEALLRSHIQHLRNVHFIFAGSQKHLMNEMFTSHNRPFFQSTQMFPLAPIPEEPYYAFAQRHFQKHNQSIAPDVFHDLYEMVHGHTWYVQCMLNRLYQFGTKTIDEAAVRQVLAYILEEYKETYRTYCNLLTQRQLEVLRAIATEGYVKEIGAQEFLLKHQLGAGSTVRSAVATLLKNELLMEEDDGYSVYDRFFGMWLKRRP